MTVVTLISVDEDLEGKQITLDEWGYRVWVAYKMGLDGIIDAILASSQNIPQLERQFVLLVDVSIEARHFGVVDAGDGVADRAHWSEVHLLLLEVRLPHLLARSLPPPLFRLRLMLPGVRRETRLFAATPKRFHVQIHFDLRPFRRRSSTSHRRAAWWWC